MLFNELKKMELPWLRPLVESWQAGEKAGRAPHAVLLAGAAGVGKRALAAWIARDRLSGAAAALPEHPSVPPADPDLHWLRPPEDKRSIGIEQIRELVTELALTSHGARGKVAVIEPADAMTVSAANSLLKTLEEPPGDALLILVADRPGRLPPTVRSRCQRLDLRLPPEGTSLAWLDRWQPGGNWGSALRDAGGAPLRALDAYERLEETLAMARDLGGIAERRVSPLDVAGRWAKEDPAFVLEWLTRQVQQCILRASGGAATPAAVADSVLNRMDRRNLFCYLDTINGLRNQPAGSFNVELTLESLLIDWARGLEGCHSSMTGNPEASTSSGAG